MACPSSGLMWSNKKVCARSRAVFMMSNSDSSKDDYHTSTLGDLWQGPVSHVHYHLELRFARKA